LEENKNFCHLRPYVQIGFKSKWPPIIPEALEFVHSMGLFSTIKLVHTGLLKWEESRLQALETFERKKRFMYPISARVIENLIKEPV
jgi:hypothetical protein